MVVLPEPLGPSKPRIVPAGTVKETSSRAWTAPKRLCSPSATIAGSTVMALRSRTRGDPTVGRGRRGTGQDLGHALGLVFHQQMSGIGHDLDVLDAGNVGGEAFSPRRSEKGVVTTPQQEGGTLEAAQPVNGMRGGLVVGGVDLAGEEPAGLARLWGSERLARISPDELASEHRAVGDGVASLSAQRNRTGRDHAHSTTCPTTDLGGDDRRSSVEGQLSYASTLHRTSRSIRSGWSAARSWATAPP